MRRLIDANELIDAVYAFEHDHEENTLDAYYVQNIINEQPTVDAVERKRGEWVQLYDNVWYCTNCENTEQFAENIESTSDWCPNCGASMKGADDE